MQARSRARGRGGPAWPHARRRVNPMGAALAGSSTPLAWILVSAPLPLDEMVASENQRPSTPTAAIGASQPCRSELSVMTRAKPNSCSWSSSGFCASAARSAARAEGITNSIVTTSASRGGTLATSAAASHAPSRGGACAGPARAAATSAPPLQSTRRRSTMLRHVSSGSPVHASLKSSQKAAGERSDGKGTDVHAAAAHTTTMGRRSARGGVNPPA